MPISRSRKNIIAVGFTHNPDESHGRKYKMIKNINPEDREPMYAKVDLENNKASIYKHEPKYKKFRIADVDRPAINKIKKGTYK